MPAAQPVCSDAHGPLARKDPPGMSNPDGGGEWRVRTSDLLLNGQPLYQLS